MDGNPDHPEIRVHESAVMGLLNLRGAVINGMFCMD